MNNLAHRLVPNSVRVSFLGPLVNSAYVKLTVNAIPHTCIITPDDSFWRCQGCYSATWRLPPCGFRNVLLERRLPPQLVIPWF